MARFLSWPSPPSPISVYSNNLCFFNLFARDLLNPLVYFSMTMNFNLISLNLVL